MSDIKNDRDRAPVLWIIMRDDLASMNPGKAVAQGAHAANMAIEEAEIAAFIDEEEGVEAMLTEWTEDRSFGTTITLSADGTDMLETVAFARDCLGLIAGVVHDPTYPLRDGEVLSLIHI